MRSALYDAVLPQSLAESTSDPVLDAVRAARSRASQGDPVGLAVSAARQRQLARLMFGPAEGEIRTTTPAPSGPENALGTFGAMAHQAEQGVDAIRDVGQAIGEAGGAFAKQAGKIMFSREGVPRAVAALARIPVQAAEGGSLAIPAAQMVTDIVRQKTDRGLYAPLEMTPALEAAQTRAQATREAYRSGVMDPIERALGVTPLSNRPDAAGYDLAAQFVLPAAGAAAGRALLNAPGKMAARGLMSRPLTEPVAPEPAAPVPAAPGPGVPRSSSQLVQPEAVRAGAQAQRMAAEATGQIIDPVGAVPTAQSPSDLVAALPQEMQTGLGQHGARGPVPVAPPAVSPAEMVDRLPAEMQTSRGMLGVPEEAPTGGVVTPVVTGLTGAGVGGAGGAAAGAQLGDTPEVRRRNAIVGGILGALAGGYAGIKAGKAIEARNQPETGALPLRAPEPEPPELTVSQGGAPDLTPPKPIPATVEQPGTEQFVNVAKFDLADPAGEIRLRQQVSRMRETAGEAWKRPVTWEETKATAAQLGLNPADILKKDARRLTGGEMLAMRDLISANVDAMQTLAQRASDPVLTAAERTAIARQLSALDTQNLNYLEKFSRARTGAGRDLNSLKILANRTMDPAFWLLKAKQLAGPHWDEPTRQTVQQLLSEGDPTKLVGFLADLRQATPGEKLVTFWKANLLTNPLTHAVNLSSNTTIGVMEMAKDAPAALADRLMALATGTRTMAGPTPRMLAAGARGAKEGAIEAGKILKGVPLEEALTKWDIPHQVNYDNVILDTYTKTVFRALGAEDRIYRGAALRYSLANQMKVARVAEPTDAMVVQAIADAEQATFQDATAAGRLLGHIGGFAPRGVPVGKFIAPFTRTPGAVATRIAEYSPAGLVVGTYDVANVVQKALRGLPLEPGAQRAAARLVGRGAVGSGFVWAGYELAKAGKMTGTASDEQAQKDTDRLLGETPGALKIGTRWVGVGRLAPAGNLLALGANLYSAAQQFGTRNLSQNAGAIISSIGRTVLDQPFLTGISGVIEGVKDPVGAGGRFLQNTATGFVPASALLAAVARGTDPGFHQPTDVTGALAARIPGLSRTQPAALNQFGEAKRREGGLVGALLNPTQITTDQTAEDPVLAAVKRLGVTITERRAGKERDRPDTRALVAREGPLLRNYLSALVQNPEWQALPVDRQKEQMERVIDRVRSFVSRQERARRIAAQVAAPR